MKKTKQTKIKVAILGATGAVGQRFITLLANHPWFEVAELVASERSAGKSYGQVVHWLDAQPIPEKIGALTVKLPSDKLTSRWLFSGLDAAVAGDIEADYAKKGHIVISNSKNHRMERDVPLVVPEANADHLEAAVQQLSVKHGAIITNPNCVVAILAAALAPLHQAFKLTKVMVTSLQAISGAGYPGVAAWDLASNVLPFIKDEEPKVEGELAKILGTYKAGQGFSNADFKVSASCYRVPVLQGHSLSVSIATQKKASQEDILAAWRKAKVCPKLPSSPKELIHYYTEACRPQPLLDVMLGDGMTVSAGRLRKCSVLDWKFSLLGHNTIRGAAGGAVLNAEYLLWRLQNMATKPCIL